ncbi:hypothetical protein N7462_010392 [Penicillium macrosclerotiorum]|uniref:uncharacterized protein n=1 Tax=Penicillium macrosclerotiorum TaxID=303699 RepID=UPI0025471E01|nr:uncharacterized protein N7462_010392 [Penicillium macrosclerotiorum]KAJ5669322.1 hypothetical protein N7462_010392 [Penicillium macrosclerotiorum]
MAPEAPDPHSLKSWQDAFQYPIPTARRVEQELRRDIASNKEKLRALVGTRYRELVGTAETIVEMNKHIQEAETTLADVGRRCNPRLVEKKHLHARRLQSDDAEKNAEKHAFGAQLALLHRCTTTITRLLRKRASLLLVAKILAVSRWLHETLSQYKDTPPFLDDLRKQLTSLRRTVVKRIDRRLASISAADDSIIESLAAFCLLTKSSADDAIHQFQQVRLDVITSLLESSCENIPKALRLFIRTLQTSKVLRSRQFSDVLSKLKAKPILSDPEVRGLDELDIEILGRWAAPAVTNFTPWIKLSEISRSESVNSIKKWSLEAFEEFAECCQKALARSKDFSALLSLRARTLELWLSSWGSTITHRSEDVFERLRNTFSHHLRRVLAAQVQTIDDVAGQISSIISAWESSEHSSIRSLWEPDLIVADYSNGAAIFKQAVGDRLLGRDEDVSAVLKKYQSWLTSVQELNESIESLRRSKWTEILVGGEFEDEDIDIAPRLNEEDPRILSESMKSAIRGALENLQISISDASKAFGASNSSGKATFLLRTIRLVRREIPRGLVTEDFTFSKDAVPDLQNLLATAVISQSGPLAFLPSSNLDTETKGFKLVPGRSLWEAELAIPLQPSPSTFKYLRRLTATMDESGPDLWDPSTVRVLKEVVKKELQSTLDSTLVALEAWVIPNKTAPDAKDGDSSEDRETKEKKSESKENEDSNIETTDTPSQTQTLKDWKIQLFFDALYLANMLGDSTQLADFVERVQKSAEASPEVAKSAHKFAQEYWKRTELLFGLLVER